MYTRFSYEHIEIVLAVCAEQVGLSARALMSKAKGMRVQRYVDIRCIAIAMLRKYWTTNLSALSRNLNLDRTTIKNMIKNSDALLSPDMVDSRAVRYRMNYEHIDKEVKNALIKNGYNAEETTGNSQTEGI